MDPQTISTVSDLKDFLDKLPSCNDDIPSLYIDLEGNNLSRSGTLSLLTILVEPRRTIYLIDVTTLGREAFTTASSNQRTLQYILESNDIIKVFFDIRNDSDALFGLYGIRVAGIQDLQLMELAARRSSKRCVNGLARCIEQDAQLGIAEQRTWKAVKERGRDLFAPERGGSYAVFDTRPLSDDMKKYCVQDVSLMPVLRELYSGRLNPTWWVRIREETNARIILSQSSSFNGKGRHMAMGPTEWLNR